MLWLDTAIYFDMAKIESGELPQDNPHRNLLSTLREIVVRKVAEGKLICPQSEQANEIGGV